MRWKAYRPGNTEGPVFEDTFGDKEATTKNKNLHSCLLKKKTDGDLKGGGGGVFGFRYNTPRPEKSAPPCRAAKKMEKWSWTDHTHTQPQFLIHHDEAHVSFSFTPSDAVGFFRRRYSVFLMRGQALCAARKTYPPLCVVHHTYMIYIGYGRIHTTTRAPPECGSSSEQLFAYYPP